MMIEIATCDIAHHAFANQREIGGQVFRAVAQPFDICQFLDDEIELEEMRPATARFRN